MGDRPEQLRTMWWAAIAMCLAGAAVLFGTLPEAFDPDTSDHGWIVGVAVFGTVVAVGMLLAGPRRRAVVAAPFVAIVVIGLLVAIARPAGAVPYFFLWPILYVAAFLNRRALVGALLLFYVSFAVGLALGEEPIKKLLFIGSTGSITLAAIVVLRLTERQDQLMAELRRSAASDPLTGLLNRRGLESAFDRDLERAGRLRSPLTVVALDLDHFKRLNDEHGHAAGDEALTALADVLRREARGGDAVARIGGEEFAVVLNDCGEAGALQYVERVSAAAPHALSAGIAPLTEAHATRDALMLAADRALYAAKAAGRGCVVVDGDARPRPLVRPQALAGPA